MSGRFCNHTLHLMMFKLFRNKSNRAKIIDRVFMHQRNKWNHCEKILTEKPKTIFIGWFDETIAELENFITRHNVSLISVLNARTIHKSQAEGSGLIFIEHNKELAGILLIRIHLGVRTFIYRISAMGYNIISQYIVTVR